MTIAKETVRARPRTFALIAGLLLLNIGLSAFVSLYQKPRLAGIQGDWFEKRREAAGDSARGRTAAYRQAGSDLQTWRSRIIPKKDFARLVGTLFETARNNALDFKGVSYKVSPVKGEDLVAYGVDLHVVGKYGAIKSFIADLGRRREIMTIDNLSLTSSVDRGESISLKVQMTIYLRTEGQ